MKNPFAPIMKRLFFILILLGLLINLSWIISEAAGDFSPIVENIHQPALYRSAIFFRSERFANYIDFIYKTVPEDEKILIPPDKLNTWKTLGEKVLIQFYLQKYDIVQCQVSYSDCVKANLDNDFTILYVKSELNGLETDNLKDRLVMANDGVGLILSPNFEPGELPNFDPVRSGTLIWYTIRAFLWASVFIIAGALWMDILAHRLRIIQKLTLGYGFMLGASTFSLFLFMLMGKSLDVWVVVGNVLIWVGLAVWLHKKKFNNFNSILEELKHNGIPTALLLTLLLYFAVVLFIALGKGYYSIDAIALWAARGYGLVVDGLPVGLTAWGSNATAYPLNAMLLVAQTEVLFQGLLPEGKLIFVLVLFALFLLFYDFLQVRVGKWTASGAVLLFGFNPHIFLQSTRVFTNITTSFYVFGACILLVEFIEASSKSNSEGATSLFPNWLIVLFFIFGAWTRPEVINIGLVFILIISIVFKKKLFANFKQGSGFVLLYLSYFVFWTFMANYLYRGVTLDDSLYKIMLNQWMVRDFHIPQIFFIIQYYLSEFFKFRTYLIFGILITIGILFAIVQLKRISRSSLILIALGFLYIFMDFGVYYLVSYINFANLHWWVATGLNRLTMPGEIAIWAGLILGVFGKPTSSEERNLSTP